MIVIDNENRQIKVTDLNKAIAQANEYRKFRIINPEFKILSHKLHVYWKDLYQKLVRFEKKT